MREQAATIEALRGEQAAQHACITLLAHSAAHVEWPHASRPGLPTH